MVLQESFPSFRSASLLLKDRPPQGPSSSRTVLLKDRPWIGHIGRWLIGFGITKAIKKWGDDTKRLKQLIGYEWIKRQWEVVN